MKKRIAVACTLIALSACHPNPPIVGKCGEYQSVQGWAEITEIKPVKHPQCANQAQEVSFRFIPAPGAKDPMPNIYTTSVSLSGYDALPLPWLKQYGWMPGSRHKVTKKVQLHGACPPAVYVFPELDEQKQNTLVEVCRGSIKSK